MSNFFKILSIYSLQLLISCGSDTSVDNSNKLKETVFEKIEKIEASLASLGVEFECFDYNSRTECRLDKDNYRSNIIKLYYEESKLQTNIEEILFYTDIVNHLNLYLKYIDTFFFEVYTEDKNSQQVHHPVSNEIYLANLYSEINRLIENYKSDINDLKSL